MFRPGQLAATPYFGVTYHFGERAYEQWAKDLRDLDYPVDAEKSRPTGPEIYDLSTMVYQVEQIVLGRAAAAGFCDASAEILPEAADYLAVAASAYREEVTIAEEALAPFLSGDERQWKAWLSEEPRREAGVATILQLLDRERAALAAVENVLALMQP